MIRPHRIIVPIFGIFHIMSDTHILLAQGISQLGLELSPQVHSQLQHYMAALQKWNAAFNLTAIREPREIVIKHFLDSLSILPHLRGNTLLDVGTGAGFPALVLAIVKPDLQVDLLDSNSKKTRFLVQMVAELGLKNVRVHHARVEQANIPPQAQIVSRAFSSLADFSQWCRHLMSEDGILLAMKGQYPQAEIDELPTDMQLLSSILLQVPFLDEARHLLVLGRT